MCIEIGHILARLLTLVMYAEWDGALIFIFYIILILLNRHIEDEVSNIHKYFILCLSENHILKWVHKNTHAYFKTLYFFCQKYASNVLHKLL